jgi:GT2 family glycosyltransferase
MLEDVGLFDEGFFLYFEDADLCLRATARGWRLAVAEQSVVFHHGGATASAAPGSGEADRRLVRASGRFLGKHMGGRLLVAAPARLARLIARRVRDGEAGRIPGATRAFIAGVASGVRDRGTSAR